MLHLYQPYRYHKSPLLNSDKIREQQQTSRSLNRLYRYNHEPVSSNFLRRDIPPIIILLFFLFLIIIILSQILVVHTSRYGSNYSSMQKIQEELRKMDDSMETILRDNVLPIDKWRLLFHIQTYLYRFEYLFYLFNNQSKSTNEILNEENNIKPIQNRFEEMINMNNNSFQLKRKKTRYFYSDNHKRRNYCNEQPSQLSMFKQKSTIVLFSFSFVEGRIFDENSTFPNMSLNEIEMNYSNVRSGGHWSPSHCLARHRVRQFL